MGKRKFEESLLCPITREALKDPVMTCDGHTYEREAIQRWFDDDKNTSPLTGKRLRSTQVEPNHALRKVIEEKAAVDATVDSVVTAEELTSVIEKLGDVKTIESEVLKDAGVGAGCINRCAILVAALHHKNKDLLKILGAIKALCKEGEAFTEQLNVFCACDKLLELLDRRVDDMNIVETTLQCLEMLLEDVSDEDLTVNYLIGISSVLTRHSGIQGLHSWGLKALGYPFSTRVERAWPVPEPVRRQTLESVVASMNAFSGSSDIQNLGCWIIEMQLIPEVLTAKICDAVAGAFKNRDHGDLFCAVAQIVRCSTDGARMMSERGLIDLLQDIGRLSHWKILCPMSKLSGTAIKLVDAGICDMFKTNDYTSYDEDMLGTMTGVCLGDPRSHEPIVRRGICQAVSSSLRRLSKDSSIREAAGFIQAISVCEAARTLFVEEDVPATLCEIMVKSNDVVEPCAKALAALQSYELDTARCGHIVDTLKKNVGVGSRREPLCAVLRSVTAIELNRICLRNNDACFQVLAEVIRKGEAGADDAWWSLIALTRGVDRPRLRQISDIEDLACNRLAADDDVSVSIMSAAVFRPDFRDVARYQAFVTKAVDWIIHLDADVARVKASCRLLASAGITLVLDDQKPVLLNALYEKLLRFNQDQDIQQRGWTVIRCLIKVSYRAIPLDLLSMVLDTFGKGYTLIIMEVLRVLSEVIDRPEVVLSIEQHHLVSRLAPTLVAQQCTGVTGTKIVLSLLMHGSLSTKQILESSGAYRRVRGSL